MGKRAISELIAEDDVVVRADSPSRKKSRRDKSAKSRKAATGDGLERGDAPTAAEAASNANGSSAEDAVDEEAITRAERKAAKKARREAREARKAEKRPGKASQQADADASAVEEDGTANKAARKAEKKRLKKSAQSEAIRVESAAALKTGSAPVASITGYVEHPELTALTQSEIDAYLSSNFVTIEDPLHSKLRPITKFSYLPVADESLRAPFASFTAPTPIQAATWPALLSGRDMIGVAETGSGKTLAFGVPCIRFILSLPKKDRRGVKAVIVSPTRELASQIYDQLVKLATPAQLQVVCVYGGVPKDPQAQAVRTAHIVVATPGRLNDLIGDGSADLSKAEYVVLDEADRMLDKGFEEAIRQIIQCTAKKRQTLMFTATWPPSVRELASTFMQSPVKIDIGDNPTGELRANTRIKQLVEVVDPRGKEFRLLQLIKQYQSGSKKNDRILVFCLYKKEATRIENFINSKGFKVAGIHGDLSQERRTASLNAFKTGNVPLLVATDVAAR
ncbi:P-loop containing nucleoside triphosphate hydrolase protein [Massariosphaeria phaeospora]|uniref:RNA helicase n=1 Tax=Massariosphaeria phaeospora TaxID=100035 RepID=A0A7C8IGQ6_9PLEO|nr:P-loop containing nucleoside triphosphate hydrolase protein [Massariosphaeria phaeospora]